MKLSSQVKILRRHLIASNDLRRRQWQGNPNPYAGHCYVACESLFYLLGGKQAGFKPMHVNVDGISHWYLLGPNGVIDPTADQFPSPVPYNKGRGKGFLTSKPSKRAQILMERCRGQRQKS